MTKYINRKTVIAAAVLVAAAVVALLLRPGFSQALTQDEAKEIAKKYVPSTAVFVKTEEEDNKYEIMFHDDTAAGGYEVEVHKDTKAVKKVEFQLDNDIGSKTVVKTEKEVKQAIKEGFPGVTSVSVKLTKDNGYYKYEADFTADEFYGDADVNPETGVILESTVKYGTAVVIPKSESGSSSGYITSEQAEKAALDAAGGGFVNDCDFDKENGEYVYEVEVIKDGVEYDYIVDAGTGKAVLEGKHESYFDYEGDKKTGSSSSAGSSGSSKGSSSSSAIISETKARNIVLAKIPGASIKKIKLDRDDGKTVYEGEAVLGDYEYEFEINASTGVITEWEKERIDHDDHDDHDDDD